LARAIDYRHQDYEVVVNDLTGGRGVQLILDPFGGKHWLKNYRLLAPTGRLVHFGVSTIVTGKRRSLLNVLKMLAQVPVYTPFKLMRENKAVIGINLAHLWDYVDWQRDWMRQLITWYDEALFRPHIDRTFKFEKAAEAHHYIQDRKNIGKILLIP
jgi:NADPH:quinone reductase-like Zn-dependent oxidoreductase